MPWFHQSPLGSGLGEGEMFFEEMYELKPVNFFRFLTNPTPAVPTRREFSLMRSGFGDIASLFLPPERYYLLSPFQAEVDVVRRNRPDLTVHNIEEFFRPNPGAVRDLPKKITGLLEKRKAGPDLRQSPFFTLDLGPPPPTW